MQIFILEHHETSDLLKFIDKALLDQYVKEKNPTVKELMQQVSGGTRRLLNAFELSAIGRKNNVIDVHLFKISFNKI